MKRNIKLITLMTALIGYSTISFADESSTLLSVQNSWAKCNYGDWTADSAKANCFEGAIKSLEADLAMSPNSNELKTWLAIEKSSLAGSLGGLDGLAKAKEAKALLEAVIQSDPTVLEGSALTTLGTLYYMVPGWPVGFGDDEKAETYLKQALSIAPDAIDTNYFYADYLIESGKSSEAKTYLLKAKAAPARMGREIADSGRQKEIETLLSKIE